MDGANPLSRITQGSFLFRHIFDYIQFKLDMLMKLKMPKTEYLFGLKPIIHLVIGRVNDTL